MRDQARRAAAMRLAVVIVEWACETGAHPKPAVKYYHACVMAITVYATLVFHHLRMATAVYIGEALAAMVIVCSKAYE